MIIPNDTLEDAGTFEQNLGNNVRFQGFKSTRLMPTGHVNLMEYRRNDRVRMLFDVHDMITE